MSIGGIAGLVAQTPAGAFVDRTHHKRAVVVAAAVVVTLGSCLLPFLPNELLVDVIQALTGASGAIFPPAVAAITLGIVGPRAFTRRVGRNEAFNHGGNAFAAVVAGVSAYFFGPVVVFFLMATMALLSILAILAIPGASIDHDVARGLVRHTGEDVGAPDRPSRFRVLLESRPLLVFAACVTLFHFANAAMLPLVGQKLALANRNLGTSLMSVCIVAAQLVMVPMAKLVGARADRWGRKPLFLAGFLILPIRGALYTLSDNPTGSSACNCSTAWPRVFLARYSRSWSPT